MDVFDIIGPVMVGPSSSHTAGAVRIGKMVREILGSEPAEVLIWFHGSFAETFKGHGTDKAIIAGLLGYATDDLRIKQSLDLAMQRGLGIRIETTDLGDVHPNTALIEAQSRTGKKVAVIGSSIGGGNIVIRCINGLPVEFTGQYHTLLVAHNDVPGAVAAVTNLLAKADINIAQMRDYRTRRGSDALMLIETDQVVSEQLVTMMGSLPHIISATKIERI